MKNRARSGVSTIATRKEVTRAIATVSGNARMNSPVAPESIRNGRKEQMMVNVAVSTGIASSLALRQAAVSRSTP